MLELVVSLPAAGLVQRSRLAVIHRRCQDEALGPRLDRPLSGAVEQPPADAAPADIRTDEEIVEDP